MGAYQVWSPIAWAYPRAMQGPHRVTLTKTCKARSSRQPPFSSALGCLLAHQGPAILPTTQIFTVDLPSRVPEPLLHARCHIY